MPNQKEFRIVINGISESISQIDSLISKIDSLSSKIESLNRHGISIQTTGGGGSAAASQVQQVQQVEAVQKEITVEVTRQRDAIAEQTSLMRENLGVQGEALQIANSLLGNYDQNLSKLVQYKEELETIKQARKDIDAAAKAGTMSDEEAAAARKSLLDTELQIKQAKSETERIMRNEVKLSQSQAGSYDQMSYTLSRLKDALKVSNSGNLSPENFEKISQAVTELDRELKRSASSMGEWQRNVGNYSSAADGFGKITVAIAGVNRDFDSLRSAIVAVRNQIGVLEYTALSTGKEIGSEMETLESQLNKLELAQQAVNDKMEEAKHASSGLHAAVEAVQGLVAIGSIGQGFASLFGIDDSALGEQIKKLTSLMAIMQGLQQLSTQMATGTGIGPALKKVFDVSGINNDWNQLKESLTVIGQRLGIVKTQAEGAAVGMGALAASAKVAEAAVKGIGRALLIGFLIEGVVWTIELLVDGFKALYDVCHDWLSMEDDVERANKGLKESYEDIAKEAEAQEKIIDEAVGRGAISEYDAIIAKQEAWYNAIGETVEGLQVMIALQERAGNIHPQLADWGKLNKTYDELIKRIQNGEDVSEEWGRLMSTVLNDVAARAKNVDTTDQEALKHFSEWMATTPLVQRAMKHFGDTAKEATDAAGNGFLWAADQMNPLLDKIIQGNNELARMQNEFDDMLKKAQYWEKYGNLNQYYIDKENKRATDLANTPGITGGTQEGLDKIKKMNEAQHRERTSANRKTVAAAKKTAYDLANIERQIQADKIAIMRDGLTKTLATIEEERRARLDAIKKYPASKQEEARVAANARYDKQIRDARTKANDEMIAQEREFRTRIAKIYDGIISDRRELAEFLNTKEQGNNTRKVADDYYAQVLNGWREELKEISDTYDKTDKAIKKLKHDYADVISLTGEELKLSPERIERYNEYSEQLKVLEKNLKEVQERQKAFDNSRLLEHTPDKFATEPTAVANFKIMMEYMFESLSEEEAYYDRRKKLQIDAANDAARIAEREAEERLRTEQDSLVKRWESLLEDEEALRTHYLTEEQITEWAAKSKAEKEIAMNNIREMAFKEYSMEMKHLVEVNSKELENIEAKRLAAINKAEVEYTEEDRRLFAQLHDNRLNELEKFYTNVSNVYNDIQKKSMTAMGIIDIGKLLGTGKRAIKEYEGMIEQVDYAINGLLSDAATNMVDPVAFNNLYSQLVALRKKVKETIQGIHDDMNAGEIWKGFDEWIQRVAQSFQQVLSAIFAYQNGEFDRMQEAIDKELEAVQKKYDEMEELAQKHKDAMNNIEDELSTARGDRRAHLIDALSAEIQAQRDALAAQRKAEKEKETLEKKADKLELQRKKKQRQQEITQAILNGALAISQAATNKWPVPAIPLMALAGAATAAQVAIMSATHYRDGGLLKGRSHEQGGIYMGGGVEAEGDEFIINKRTTTKNLPLIEYINSKKRKLDIGDFIEFYNGKGQRSRQPIIQNKFADGGLLPNIDLAERLVNVVIDRDTRPIYVSVVDINRAQQRVAQVEQLAGLQ